MENATNAEEWSCSSSQSIAASELLARLNGGSPSFKAVMAIPLVLLSVMILMFIDACVFILRNSSNLKRSALTIWIISIYPVMGAYCITGLYMPRTAAVVAFARNFYFAIAMKKFFDLVLNYYGGKTKMIEALNGAIVPTNPIPFCCIYCNRKSPLTLSRLKKLKATVYQVVIVYPISYYTQTLLASEGLLRTSVAAQIISVIAEALVAVSGFVCLYGFSVIGRASRISLQQYFFVGKYFSVSLLVVCNTLQNFILEILQRFDVLPCDFPYPDPQRAFLFQCYIFLFELFAISLLGWYSYRRSDEHSEVTTTNVPELTISNVFNEVRKNSEAGGGGDNQAIKYNVENWLERNEKYKASEINV